MVVKSIITTKINFLKNFVVMIDITSNNEYNTNIVVMKIITTNKF